MGEPWYAIYTRFQHEKSAASLLEKKRLKVFLPVYRAIHFWKDRNQEVILPLFPCYLFVQTSLDRKLDVLRTPGVRWLVESASHACEVPAEEVESLQRICSAAGRLEPYPFLKEGERVRVRQGPLADIEGFFVRTKNQSRVVISVELLRKSVSVEVEVGSIERLCDAREMASVPAGIFRREAPAYR